MVDSPSVAIIGSGIAGSAAAWRLATAPSRPSGRITVYEIGRRPGGRGATRKTRSIPELSINHGVPYADISTEQGRALLAAMGDSIQPYARTLAITGGLLWITDRLPPRPKGLRDIRPTTALGIGIAQGLSLMPGISRSGITIAASLLFGLKRRWAAEYSFFLAIPTILAATLVQFMELQGAGGATRLGWLDMAVGMGVAAVVGTLALMLVVKLLYRAKLRIFYWYLWFLAILVALGIVPIAY